MSRTLQYARHAALPLLVAALCLRALGDRPVEARPAAIAFSAAMPQTVLWAWEEPEDLRTADPRTTGVAYLAETLLLGSPNAALTTLRRHQPLLLAPNTAVMAVVRIQTRPGFRDTPELRAMTSAALVALARTPGSRALQIDFDATRSQRAFYTAILRDLRQQMPATMPLSITALASWCASAPTFGSALPTDPDWLAALPIDEAVPMLFRLGGHTKPYGDKDALTLREPLCRASLGLSTDESWPALAIAPGPHRTYLFSPQPWQPAQLAAAASLDLASRPAALRIHEDPSRPGINDTGLHPESPATSEPQP